MKHVKEHSSQHFKGGMEIILYSFSLIANSLDMLEVKKVLFNLVFVLSSDRQSELYIEYFAHINEFIKRMSNEHKSNTSITSTACCDIITNDDSFVPSSDSVTEINCDEGDLFYMSPDSPFLLWGNGIYESANQSVVESLSECGKHVTVNKFDSSLLLDKLIIGNANVWKIRCS